MTAGDAKCPNNVTCTSFNTVNLLPKHLRFEHMGAPHLHLAPGASNLVAPLWETLTFPDYSYSEDAVQLQQGLPRILA